MLNLVLSSLRRPLPSQEPQLLCFSHLCFACLRGIEFRTSDKMRKRRPREGEVSFLISQLIRNRMD